MFATIAGFLLNLAGSSFVGKVLTYLENRTNADVEKQRISSVKETTLANTAAAVVVAGMGHRVFWVAWSIAAVPTMAWFGWGMLDSLFNGALPDVAALPIQLKGYADIVFGNVFYAGAAGLGFSALTSTITAITQRRG